MGYNTSYQLTVIEPKRPTVTEIIEILRAQREDAHYAIDSLGKTLDSAKWYEHESDMKAFSLQFPNHLFVLDGVGEDGERMRKYFKNGKVQDAKPILAYEEFVESKLK